MSDRQILMLQKAIEYIESNLREPLSVADVCSQFQVSPWEFQRWFRAHVGDSIGNYLRSRRLSEALTELRSRSELNVLDIAVEFQFGSQPAFTRAFKSYFDITPGEARTSNINFDRLVKPRVTGSLLKHLKGGIAREPQLKILGPFRLIGLSTEIRSIHQYEDYIETAPKVWREFVGRRNEISGLKSDLKYGIAVGDEMDSSESLKYLAAVDCEEHVAIPPGMMELLLLAREYAIFENVGLATRSRDTIDYIYGFWLPESRYKRSRGHDFEIFDHRYNLKSENSISTYCIPVELQTD